MTSPGHQWRYANPYRRECTRCGFGQSVCATELETGPTGSGLCTYSDEQWEPENRSCTGILHRTPRFNPEEITGVLWIITAILAMEAGMKDWFVVAALTWGLACVVSAVIGAVTRFVSGVIRQAREMKEKQS